MSPRREDENCQAQEEGWTAETSASGQASLLTLHYHYLSHSYIFLEIKGLCMHRKVLETCKRICNYYYY